MVEQQNTATRLLSSMVMTLRNERDIHYVRMVYEWRLHKNSDKLMDTLTLHLVALGFDVEFVTLVVDLSDKDVIISLMDAGVLVGGEYMYLHEGKEIVDALEAEAIERNYDKQRCSWCWKDKVACSCSHDAQYEEMKYD